MAYFQSYSGTYAPVETLRRRYEEALAVEGVMGLVIGTRPDCIDHDVLDLLAGLAQTHKVVVEYGVESCYDTTLQRIERGHDYACAERAIRQTADRGIEVGIHLILGLPGETRSMILDEARIISALPIHSIKLHQLQIMRGTRMADEWLSRPQDFLRLTAETYAELVTEFVQRLRPDIVLERFAASAPSPLLLAPRWGIKPQAMQQMIEERIRHSQSTVSSDGN